MCLSIENTYIKVRFRKLYNLFYGTKILRQQGSSDCSVVHCLLPAVYLHNKLEWKPPNHTFYLTHTQVPFGCTQVETHQINSLLLLRFMPPSHYVKVEISFVSFRHLAVVISEQSQIPSNEVRILVIASANHRYPLNATLYRGELSHICLQV